MKLNRRLYNLALAALTTAFDSRAYAGGDISISGIESIIATSSVPADPQVMVIVGIGLIGLRVLIARKSRRRKQDATHPKTPQVRIPPQAFPEQQSLDVS